MNMMHLKVVVFLGGALSLYSVSCMSKVIFNPSLLNWSSGILKKALLIRFDKSKSKQIKTMLDDRLLDATA